MLDKSKLPSNYGKPEIPQIGSGNRIPEQRGGCINVLSLFDGISCGQLALQRAGVNYENYFASEIDQQAIQVTQRAFPNTKQLGDVTKIKGSELPKIDLLIGGSPCQGFSFAGKGLNFEDPRSKLFFDFVRLLGEIKPKYFFLENVVMKREYQDVITKLLGVEPVFINSSIVSAQNRKRLYWTNIPKNQNPLVDKNIFWRDVRERGVSEYYYTESAMRYLGDLCLKSGKPLRIWGDLEKAQMVEASAYKGYSKQRYFGIVEIPESEPSPARIVGRFVIDGIRQDAKGSIAGKGEQMIEFKRDGKTNTLTCFKKDNIEVPFTLPNRIPESEFFFRYITPKECERLQTIPDGYTDCLKKTARYRVIGNAWTVDVVAWFFGGLK